MDLCANFILPPCLDGQSVCMLYWRLMCHIMFDSICGCVGVFLFTYGSVTLYCQF